MGKAPDFIGLGAQRSGTSWIYACLYEHPAVYIPTKEIHFFSRERNWSRGYEWYESLFAQSPPGKKSGEFSTSYLFDSCTPERIFARYPHVKLIASLRNPIERAYSNYMLDLSLGIMKPDISFGEAIKDHPEYLDQGQYALQLERYRNYFSRDQMLLLIYEDCQKSPLQFIQTIYEFIGVDHKFIPEMINKRINERHMPHYIWIDRLIRDISATLRRKGLHRLWWFGKKANIGNSIRGFNTRISHLTLSESEKNSFYRKFEGNIDALSHLLGRDLDEWRP